LILTNKDVAHQRGRQAEDNDEHVGHREIDDEEIRDGPHAGWPVYHGDNATIADQADYEDNHVRHAVNRRHGHAVPVKPIGCVLDRRQVLAGVEQSVDLVLHSGTRTRRRDRLRNQIVEVIAEIVPHLQQGAGTRRHSRDRRGRHVAVITPAARINVELLRVR